VNVGYLFSGGCPILNTPAQNGNGLRIWELWNRVSSPGTLLPGLSVPLRWAAFYSRFRRLVQLGLEVKGK
jgi:hypothetical protein